MAIVEKSYIGKGIIYLALLESGVYNPLLPVGNCSALNLSFEEDKQQLKNYMSLAGGNINSVSTISNFTGSMTAYDMTGSNIAKAFRGTYETITVATVPDEAHESEGTENELIVFDYRYDSSQPVTVTKADATALTAGTDYVLTPNGIRVTSGTSIDATGVLVSYTKSAAETMQALVESGQEFALVFDGMNSAQSGAATMVKLHRVKFSPASDFALLGDEYSELTMEFEVLADTDKDGATLSQYMEVSLAA